MRYLHFLALLGALVSARGGPRGTKASLGSRLLLENDTKDPDDILEYKVQRHISSLVGGTTPKDELFHSIAVGIVTPTATKYFGLSREGADEIEQPTPDTLFEIASITKVFTALALADLVLEKGSEVEIESNLS